MEDRLKDELFNGLKMKEEVKKVRRTDGSTLWRTMSLGAEQRRHASSHCLRPSLTPLCVSSLCLCVNRCRRSTTCCSGSTRPSRARYHTIPPITYSINHHPLTQPTSPTTQSLNYSSKREKAHILKFSTSLSSNHSKL